MIHDPIRPLAALCLAVFIGSALWGADTWQNYTVKKGLPHDEIRCLYAGKKALYVGTMNGMVRFAGGKCSPIIKGGQINDIRVLSQGMFVASSHGVHLLKPGGKPASIYRGGNATLVLPFTKDTQWVLTKNTRTERNALLQGKVGSYKAMSFFKDKQVEDMFRSKDGRMWVVLNANGVYEVAAGGDPKNATHHLKGINIKTMFEDKGGAIWCGTQGKGVYTHNGKRWARHLNKEKSTINHIVQDGKKAIWVATSENGLYRQDGTAWKNDLKDEASIHFLATTKDGTVWISSRAQGGLRHWNGTTWAVSLDSPLPIICMAEKGTSLYAGGILDGLHEKK